MLQSIINDIKREFSTGSTITRLVIVNVGVFIAINLVKLILNLANSGTTPELFYDILYFFCISSSITHNLFHPWVFLTSMFLHQDFWHILWNMLFLYWFGKIVADLIGEHKIFPLYLLGGLVGCFAFWLSAQVLPFGAGDPVYALGASGAVMAIVTASGMIAPDYVMRLLFIGSVKLKYIVGILILLDLFGLGSEYNTGGHAAHLGGVFMGWFFIYQLRQGNDWSEGIQRFISKVNLFFSDNKETVRQPRDTKLVVKKHYKKGSAKLSEQEIQEKIDIILDKIKEGGYENLSKEEKDFLNNASSRR